MGIRPEMTAQSVMDYLNEHEDAYIVRRRNSTHFWLVDGYQGIILKCKLPNTLAVQVIEHLKPCDTRNWFRWAPKNG